MKAVQLLREISMLLLEFVVVLVDYVDLIVPALGVSISCPVQYILFFLLCIISI